LNYAIKCDFLPTSKVDASTTGLGGTDTLSLSISSDEAFLYNEGLIGRMLAELTTNNPTRPSIVQPISLFGILFPEQRSVMLCLLMPLMHSSVSPLLRRLKAQASRLPFCRRVIWRLLQSFLPLHTGGFCHADVKTDNVLVATPLNGVGDIKTCADSAQLTDLGLARWGLNSTGPCMSDEYRPPEAWLGIPWGPPVDMWGVGCIAMEILMGGTFFVDYPGDGETRPKNGRRHYLSAICRFFGPVPETMLTGLDKDALQDAIYASHPSRANTDDISRYLADDTAHNAAHRERRDLLMDLIKQLLVVDPARRMTVEDAVSHSLFHNK
jgi:serine/threonine protein kinase